MIDFLEGGKTQDKEKGFKEIGDQPKRKDSNSEERKKTNDRIPQQSISEKKLTKFTKKYT